jgi:bifunctional DNA-binding transcriptional regulator/antitoxin component of YhaV-PrlF toxin-antitoxin module
MMNSITASSKLTSKYQATIPRPVRRVLGLARGDRIAFVVRKKEVRLKKFGPGDLEYLEAIEPVMSEWTSHQDEEAYRKL